MGYDLMKYSKQSGGSSKGYNLMQYVKKENEEDPLPLERRFSQPNTAPIPSASPKIQPIAPQRIGRSSPYASPSPISKPIQSDNPIIGENLFLTNILPIRQNDNPIIKGLKGAANFGVSTLSAPGELLRKASLQGGSLLSGNGLMDLPKNTSFTQDILPKGASNALNSFSEKNPFFGGMASMGLEIASDPTSYITGNTFKTLLTPKSELGMAKLSPMTKSSAPIQDWTPPGQVRPVQRSTELGPLQLNRNDFRAKQAELMDTFNNAPVGAVDTPMARSTLQGNIDKVQGIGKPTGGYQGLDAFGKPLKSFRKSTDLQNNVDEVTAQLDNQLKGMETMAKQADEQTATGTVRKAILDRGGIRQSNDGIFEEKRIIPNWIRNDKSGMPLDQMADELGMTSDELLAQISDSKFVPKDYAKEAQVMAGRDPDYQALSGTLDGLKAQLPGKRTLGKPIADQQEIILYHGSPNSFDVKDIRTTRAQAGEGIFLTDSRVEASDFGNKIYEVKIKPNKLATDKEWMNSYNELQDKYYKKSDELLNKLDEGEITNSEYDNLTRDLSREWTFDEMSDLNQNAMVSNLLKEKGYDAYVGDLQSGNPGKEYMILDKNIISKTGQPALPKPITKSDIKLKPRELTPKPEPLPIQPAQRMGLSGSLPVDARRPIRQLTPIAKNAPILPDAVVDAPIGKATTSNAKLSPEYSNGNEVLLTDGRKGIITRNTSSIAQSSTPDYMSMLTVKLENGKEIKVNRNYVEDISHSNQPVPISNTRFPKDVQPIRSVAANIESPSSRITIDPMANERVTPIGNGRVVGAEPEIPAGLKERGVSKNIRTDANRPDELRDSLSADPLVHQQVGNKETLAKAQAIFDKGLEHSVAQLDTLLKELRPESAPLVKMIADQLTKEGNIARAREVMSNAANRATESGQFGQAFRILRDADPQTFLMTFDKQLAKLNKEGLEQYGKKWNNVDLTPDELTLVSRIERGNQASYDSAFEQIHARIADVMPATGMEKINAWRHISMLLNPTTQIRNIAGNGIMMGMRKTAQRVSGVLQKVILKESDRTQVALVNKEYKALADEYFQANSKELLGGTNKYQEGISLNMPDKRVFRKSRIGEKLGVDIDILEKTRKFNYALLQKGDNPFFEAAYKDQLASYAQAKGIKDFSQLSQEGFDIARKAAEEATYKDASIIADFINKAKRPDAKAGIWRKGGAVLVEAALPFTKTPINIIKRGLDYSPLSLASGLANIKSAKGIDEFAKGLTGTGVLGLGYLLASKGILTGKAEKDVDLKSYNSNTGQSPFSVMGKFTYDWMMPFSIPLSIGVTTYNAIKDSADNKAKMDSAVINNNTSVLNKVAIDSLNAMVDGLTASGDVVFNMSIAKGIKTLFGGTQGVMEGLSQLPQNYATQFMPTTISKLANTIDPLVRQTYVKGDRPQSFKNAIVSRIPGASMSLQPKQTPFGQDMKKIENPLGRAFSQFLSPGIITKNQDINPKIDKELRRLNNVEGLTTQFPTIVPNYIEKTQTHPRITLTPAETTLFQKRVGKLTETSFSKTINQGSYTNAKANKTKGKSADEVRADLLAAAISDAKATAKKEILKSRGLK